MFIATCEARRGHSPMRQAVLGALLLVLGSRSVFSQVVSSSSSPAINFFSVQQDHDIGNESARAAEQQLTLTQDFRLTQYIRSLTQRVLAGSVSRPERFHVNIVNSNE